jgi:hypothetical protein
MTDHPPDDSQSIRLAALKEVLDAAEVVMGVFGQDGRINARALLSPQALRAVRVVGAGDASAARAGVLLVAALVRALAEATGDTEEQVLADLRAENNL